MGRIRVTFPKGETTPAETFYLFQSNSFDDDTNVVDTMGNANGLLTNINMKHSTDQAKFGTTSFKCDGQSAILVDGNASSVVGTQDATLDYWIYRTGDMGVSGAPGQIGVSTAKGIGGIGFDTQLRIGVMSQSSNSSSHYHTVFIDLNQWVHIAIVKQGSTYYIYKNGLLDATKTYTPGLTSDTFVFGRRFHSNSFADPDNYYNNNCYFDEIRLVVGKAVWENGNTFTPPTSSYVV